jgi:hypothetical protein
MPRIQRSTIRVRFTKFINKRAAAMLGILLIVPFWPQRDSRWPHSRDWGYYPSDGLVL